MPKDTSFDWLDMASKCKPFTEIATKYKVSTYYHTSFNLKYQLKINLVFLILLQTLIIDPFYRSPQYFYSPLRLDQTFFTVYYWLSLV